MYNMHYTTNSLTLFLLQYLLRMKNIPCLRLNSKNRVNQRITPSVKLNRNTAILCDHKTFKHCNFFPTHLQLLQPLLNVLEVKVILFQSANLVFSHLQEHLQLFQVLVELLSLGVCHCQPAFALTHLPLQSVPLTLPQKTVYGFMDNPFNQHNTLFTDQVKPIVGVYYGNGILQKKKNLSVTLSSPSVSEMARTSADGEAPWMSLFPFSRRSFTSGSFRLSSCCKAWTKRKR